METLYDITKILQIRAELAAINTVEDFLQATDDGGNCGDREPRNPGPIVPIIGARALELVK